MTNIIDEMDGQPQGEVPAFQEMNGVKMRSVSYFAADGNYGDAGGMVVMETTHWDEIDWKCIEDVNDADRPIVARLLTESYEAGANQEFIRERLEKDFGLVFVEEAPELDIEGEDG